MAKPVKFLLGAEGSEKLKATEEGRVYFALSDKGVINPNIYNLFYDNGNELIPIASESKYAEKASNADKATSADKWTTPRNISVTGDVEGATTIDGSADISIPATLKSIVTAGTRGPSANATLNHGDEFKVPYIKYNAKGLVTTGATRTFTLPTETQLNKGTETSKQEALSHGGAFSAITGIDVSNHTITPTITAFTLPSLQKGTDEAATAATLTHGGSFDVLIDTKTDGSSIIDVYKTFTLPTETQLSTGTATTNQSSLSHKGTFSAITGFTVNNHKITPTVTTFTLPADSNTDTKVTQKAETRDDNSYNVLLGGSTSTAAETGSVNKAGGFSYNPAEGAISLTDKDGNIGSIYAVAAKAIASESTDTADKWTSLRNFKFTGDVQDVSQSVDGSSDVTWNLLLDEIVTGATKGPSKDTTLTHSESFVVPSFTYDNKGRITSATNRTLTLPKVGVSDEFNNVGNLTPNNKTITFPSLVSTVTADSTSDIVVTKENFGIDLSDFALFSEIPKFLIFKGTLSARDGDIPDLDAPTAEMEGWVYIVTYAGGYSNTDVRAKVGDLFICANRGSDGYKWVHVPSSDSYAAESNHATTADKWTTGRTVSLTNDVTGASSAWDGSGNLSISTTLANSGVTAGNYGPSANASPAHGGTFSVPYVSFDAKGRATAASTKTITLPTYGLATASANGLMPKEKFDKLTNLNIAYATCSTAAATAQKAISIVDGVEWELKTGAVLIVVFSNTNSAKNPTFKVGSLDAKSISYEGTVITSSNLGYAGTKNRPMIFVYDGTNFRFSGWGYDGNTNTYLRVYRQTEGYNQDLPILVSRTQTIGTKDTNASYSAVYGVIGNDDTLTPTINPITGEIKAPKFTGTLNGNASSATVADKWKTARTITYTGDATGSVTLDGSANVTCQLTVGDKWVNTTGDSMTGDLTFNVGSTQKALGVKWSSINNKNPYVGYASDQSDGTFALMSIDGTTYASGLAIGGSSGNLLWKGKQVATIESNVASADKWKTARTFKFTGDVDDVSQSVDGSGNATWTLELKNTGVTADTYGPAADETLAHGDEFIAPKVSIDVDGRITSASNVKYTLPTETQLSKGTGTTPTATLQHSGTFSAITGFSVSGHTISPEVTTFTLPSDNNTDTKVKQTVTTENKAYPLLLAPTGQTATTTTSSYFDSGVTLNPSTNTIAANISGTAATATTAEKADKWTTARTVTFKGDATGSFTLDGSANVDCTLTVADNSHSHSNYMSSSPTSIELNAAGSLPSYGGFIDFHYHDSNKNPLNASGAQVTTTPDYTSRIIEDAAGQISVNGTKFKTGLVTATKFKGDLEGNATTASTWAASRTITYTGDVTGSVTIDGSANQSCALDLSDTGVTAGHYGLSANASPAHGKTFNVPYFTVDAEGRLSAATTNTVTLPSETSVSIGTAANSQSALSHGDSMTVITGLSASGHKVTPTTVSYTLPTETQLSVSGSTGTATSLAHKGTFSVVTGITVDNHTVKPVTTTFTLPSDSDLDTKNTAGSGQTTDKIWLVGTKSQNGAGEVSYSQTTTYVDNKASLHSTSFNVATKIEMKYNASKESLDFVFA